METCQLIYNPKCSKCRSAETILTENKVQFVKLEYLEGKLTRDLIAKLPTLLNLNFSQMIRTGEQVYEDLQLADKNLSEDEWIEILLKHPILLERPIYIFGDKAIIARPPELITDVIKN